MNKNNAGNMYASVYWQLLLESQFTNKLKAKLFFVTVSLFFFIFCIFADIIFSFLD